MLRFQSGVSVPAGLELVTVFSVFGFRFWFNLHLIFRNFRYRIVSKQIDPYPESKKAGKEAPQKSNIGKSMVLIGRQAVKIRKHYYG